MAEKISYPFEAVVFDMDGVITNTAVVHAAAWKEMFDEYLQMRADRGDEPFKPFTHEDDYLPYVDGKPRLKGIQSFLESRGIHLPQGQDTDGPDDETITSLGNRKNQKFVDVIHNQGVEVFESTVSLIRALREAGVRVGVATSSKNGALVLDAAKLSDLIETRVDGIVSLELNLKGKPEPDIFTTAAANLGSTPEKTIVVEDAIVGVQAGRKGEFGLVIGIAREDNVDALRDNGADVVIEDFEGYGIDDLREWFKERKKREN